MSAYQRPVRLDEALDILAESGATIAAGCTDLFPATEAQALPGPVLDITAIEALRGIDAGAEGWRIGAATTWSDILSADLPPAFDMLKQAAREVGSVQIQNTGTIAGNLCNASPAADGVPPLMSLDALVELRSSHGSRTLPVGQFLTGPRQTVLGPGEMVTAVIVPRSAGAGQSRFLKLGARKYLVISIAMVAVRVVLRKGRIAQAAVSVGACSAVARRLGEIETRLAGVEIGKAGTAVDRGMVAAALAPIDDIRADAPYRSDAAAELLCRALDDIADPGTERAA